MHNPRGTGQDRTVRDFFLSRLPEVLVFFSSLVLFLSVLPEKLSWANDGADGGDLLTALLTGGIPHPSGYPTYLLLGSLFLSLPFSTPVWRAALLSACSAAAASALLCAWLRRYLPGARGLWLAVAACLSLSASPLFFSQAVIVEVYALQSLFFVLSLWWLDHLARPRAGKTTRRISVLLAFAFSLGLGNHLTGLFALPPALFFLMKDFKQRRWGHLLPQLAAILAGLAVYLVLPLRAAGWPPVNWGNPQTLSGLFWLVSGAPYHGLLLSFDPVQILSRILVLARLLVDQFGVLGVVLGLTGCIANPKAQASLGLSLAWIALASALFAAAYTSTDSAVYMLPVFILWAAWIGQGIGAIIDHRWRGIPTGKIACALFLLAVVYQAPATIRQANPRSDPAAEEYAARVMQSASQDAIVFTGADLDSFPLWYQHFGLRQRPDLRLIVLPLAQFAWYRDTIRHNYSDLILPAEDLPVGLWGQQLQSLNPRRPVCRNQIDPQPTPTIHLDCDAP